MSLTRFDAYVDRHAAAHVERLQALCRMPSIAARGTGLRSVAEFVGEQMQRAGGGTRFVEYAGGHPVVFGEFGAGTSCYIVYGHYDVQPVGALEDWTSGPFAAALVDGKLRARGASDSKGDLLARLVAIEAYQKTFGKLPICLRFIVEGEDAVGSPSLRRFVAENEEMLKADGCIWDDGYKDTRERLVTSLGFKGIALLKLSTTGARTDVHSKWGGIVPNPAWRLVHALSTLRAPHGAITIDDFHKHLAAPPAADIQAVRSIELDEAALRHEFRLKSWARGLSGRALARELILGPTCTICSLDTGNADHEAKTVVPGRAVAVLDFRLVPDLSPELVRGLLREHLDRRGFTDVEITQLAAALVTKSSADSVVARAATESVAEVYDAPPVVYPLDPASGPVGVVCEAAGRDGTPAPLVSFGISYSGSNPHGPDENIRLDDFLQGIKYFGRVIHRLGQLDREPRAETAVAAARNNSPHKRKEPNELTN